ncbi:hypothetical protein L596_008758 [Steinernema carpocapsae]|uniref:Carboxylic ester hydrolase n=1 Tax=Steinernema carpocapsae TaxID=34508 RepID=A0A4U5PDI4_STECR|nr:hypothetical protein L596_008758 [Steinernema carpocapsae]
MWCLVVLLLPVVAASPLVKTPYGVVEGFDYTLRDGGVANVFLGIPYAKPPVGALRYEKPEKPTAWKDVKETKTFGAPCFQHANTKLLTGEGEFSEDCLTMNIMAPSKTSTDPKGYPVMVFIYGGGFEFGSSSFYPYQNISENFVSDGIVFVTFNYRLSAFGFFSTGDNVIPGNLGYWDQTLALQFIQDVISHFGGNPDSVTITGESAGGASVSALTYSPHSNS